MIINIINFIPSPNTHKLILPLLSFLSLSSSMMIITLSSVPEEPILLVLLLHVMVCGHGHSLVMILVAVLVVVLVAVLVVVMTIVIVVVVVIEISKKEF